MSGMIAGVKFRGGAFLEDTQINFFTRSNHRICTIFRRNGSGKSTIARALKKALGQQDESIKEAVLCNECGDIITSVNGDSRGNTAIFDETYIRENIQLREHGLKTIVIFGRQGDIDKEIQKAEKDQGVLAQAVERADSILKKYMEEASDLSPGYYKKKIKGKLMGGWSLG